MTPILQITPVVLMISAAVWVVWRGFRTPPNGSSNRAKGGGAQWKNWK